MHVTLTVPGVVDEVEEYDATSNRLVPGRHAGALGLRILVLPPPPACQPDKQTIKPRVNQFSK